MCRSARPGRELARAVTTDAAVPGHRPDGAAGEEPALPLGGSGYLRGVPPSGLMDAHGGYPLVHEAA